LDDNKPTGRETTHGNTGKKQKDERLNRAKPVRDGRAERHWDGQD
jgi:hypothetical protein